MRDIKLSAHEKQYLRTVDQVKKILDSIRQSSPRFDWMLHTGGALFYYGLAEFDLDDIDIIIKGKQVTKLVEYLNKYPEVTNINIKKDRRFSKGVYKGECLEFMIEGIPVHIFNPQLSTAIINNRELQYSYDKKSFLNKETIRGINIAPIEDILLYKIILGRSEKDNKRDLEQISAAVDTIKDLDAEYIEKKVKELCIEYRIKKIIHKLNRIDYNNTYSEIDYRYKNICLDFFSSLFLT